MKIDNLRRYVDLRDSLTREKAQLEERLRQINEALGDTQPPQSAAPASTASAPPRAKRGPGGGARRGRPTGSGMSLREAVLQATSGKALTKQEILDEVQKAGYRFSTSNPMNSLGVILYGKSPKFINEGGRFRPTGGGAASKGSGSHAESKPNNGPFKRKKRTLSPEARERIAAAQRERWAKTKGGK